MDRQLHREDCLQMVSTEPKEYAEVSACQRIAENNRIITDFQLEIFQGMIHRDFSM